MPEAGMQFAFEPFDSEHLDAAAELLAARHRADRTRAPELPERFENAEAAREALRAVWKQPRAEGAAALRAGRLCGYLIGSVVLPAPGTQLARYVRPRSVVIEYAGHAVESEDCRELYRALSAALARRWLAQGCFSHYICLPVADRTAVEGWFSLGFGQESVYGLREIGATDDASTPGRLEIRRAGLSDLETVVRLRASLDRSEVDAPIWRPYLPERDAERPADVARALADPASDCWLASAAGRAVGLMLFEPGREGLDWPERCIHLDQAYVEVEARGRGVGGALLRHGLARARQSGYDRCIVDWLAPNLLGSRFWLGSGFQPITTYLVRHVDERITWAGSG
jgi:GNAT superfamily N-acetyltransferase